MPSSKHSAQRKTAVIAVDLGGTKLAAAIFDDAGQIIIKRGLKLENRQGHAVGELVTSQIHRLFETAKLRKLAVRAVGVCVPGIVRPYTGRVCAPNISDWDDYPLKAEIKATISNQGIRLAIESDRAASILGEVWQGAARNCRNAVFLAVGTGIGAGILVNGRVLQGSDGIAGAIGWLALDRPFHAHFANCGCFESRASGEGIAKVARAAVAQHPSYRGMLRECAPLTAHDVFAAYAAGDAIAKTALAQAVELWGMACANLISLFNPEIVVFGGGLFGPAAQFLPAIVDEAQRWAQPVAFAKTRFAVSQLEGAAALYGAAYLALRAGGRKN